MGIPQFNLSSLSAFELVKYIYTPSDRKYRKWLVDTVSVNNLYNKDCAYTQQGEVTDAFPSLSKEKCAFLVFLSGK